MWILISGVFLMTLSYILIGKRIKLTADIKTVDIILECCGKSSKFTLLCDSGNLLTDPYTALPVIILKQDLTDNISDYHGFIKHKTRYIPITTPSGNGIIKAIHPDKLVIVNKSENRRIDAVIGFASCINADYGGTDGIIPCCLTRNL